VSPLRVHGRGISSSYRLEGDVELGVVGGGTLVDHARLAGFGVLDLEVLVGEVLPEDALAAGTVALGDVAAAEEATRRDAVQLRAAVTKALLAGGQHPEVHRGLFCAGLDPVQ
jgi:hypothetical protein